jgi:glycosyltransferase involved in cell wall biosynthesis
MARSALAAGYEVAVYARWHPGLPPVEQREGYRLIRVPFAWQLAFPGLRGKARRRAAAGMAEAATAAPPLSDGRAVSATEDALEGGAEIGQARAVARDGAAGQDPVDDSPTSPVNRLIRRLLRPARRVVRRLARPFNRWSRLVRIFPLRPLGWASALEEVAEPADLWHGMWAGSLPALTRMRDRHGGRTIYDSRDVYMRSRDFEGAGQPGKRLLEWFERRWARSVDRVLTVNESYADLLVEQLGVPRPAVVMNCPEAWRPPTPRPDLIRTRLGLGPDTAIALYQGQLVSDRGIEQAMDAILEVPDTVLALLGFGPWVDRLTKQTQVSPYEGRVAVLEAVTPNELLRWTASADVMVMAIQPTSLNHQFTTPQKLFESIATGVPIVAANMPGMTEVVIGSGVGVVCDPTSPPAIAAAIREIVGASPAEREALRTHILSVAHDRYNWERQTTALFEVYEALLERTESATS